MKFITLNLRQKDKMSMKNQRGSDKWKIYIITFIDYVAIHNMRMCYSQIKPDFQKQYELSSLQLGIFDSLVYIALGLGFFFRFLLEGKKSILKSYAIFISIACFAYLSIPIVSISLGKKVIDNIVFQIILPAIALCIFGFCQFPAWPTLLTITSQQFNLEKDGTAIGTWSANGDLGNILGFAFAGFIVNTLQYPWQYAMIAAVAIKLSMTLIVYFMLSQYEEKSRQTSQLQQKLNDDCKNNQNGLQSHDRNDKFKKFLIFARQTIKPLENKLYLFTFGLMKSILYGFLLWMPTYLTHHNLKEYSASIPIVFNAGTLIGSSLLGYFYKNPTTANQNTISYKIKLHLKSLSLFYSCIGVTAIFAIFYVIQPEIIAYFGLSAISGACLGGCFNTLACNQVVSMSNGDKNDVNLLSTFSMFCGNIMVGIVEIIIGVVLDLKNDPQGQRKLFIILICLGSTAIIALFWRSRIIKSHDQKGKIHSTVTQ